MLIKVQTDNLRQHEELRISMGTIQVLISIEMKEKGKRKNGGWSTCSAANRETGSEKT